MFDGSTLRMKGQILIHRLLVPVLFLVGINFVHAASFDCSKVTTETERIICDDPKLSQLDELMAHAYQQALRLNKGPYNVTYVDRSVIVDKQKAALSQRNTCTSNIDCLETFYRNRIVELLTFTNFKTNSEEKQIDDLLLFAPHFDKTDNLRHLASSQDSGTTILLTWSDDKPEQDPTQILISETIQGEKTKISRVRLNAYTLFDSDLSASQNDITLSIGEMRSVNRFWLGKTADSKWQLTTEILKSFHTNSMIGQFYMKDYTKNQKDVKVYIEPSGCSLELTELPLDWRAYEVVKSLPKLRPEFIFAGWGGDLLSPDSSEFKQFVSSLDDDELKAYAFHAFSAKQLPAAKFAFEVLVDRSVPGALKDLKCVESTIAAEK